MAACIFCKIIKGILRRVHLSVDPPIVTNPDLGDIPSLKLFESERVFAFLDIQPLSQGHAVCQPPFETHPVGSSPPETDGGF